MLYHGGDSIEIRALYLADDCWAELCRDALEEHGLDLRVHVADLRVAPADPALPHVALGG